MTSVLLEFTMFPTDHGESKSEYIAQIIKLIKESGLKYQLTPMSTIIETDNMTEALSLVGKCYDKLDELGCRRVYSTLKFDIRKNSENRMEGKIKSIEDKIGEVRK